MKQRIFFPVLFLFSLTLAYSQSFDLLKGEIENCLRENGIPGAAVAVVTKEKVLLAAGFGFANLEQKIPVSLNTHFWLGSISKSFTALGLVKLAEGGRVDLNAPVKDLLPDVDIQNPWEKTDPVRLVHLLEHTAGLCDGFSMLFNWRHDPEIPLSEAIGMLKRIVIHHRPGSFYLYSNIGYLLAGAVIEKIAGLKYEEYLRREFLLPLGMPTTTFYPNEPYSRSALAQGYGAGGKAVPFLYAYFRPAAYSYSSILEMAQYVRFYLNNGAADGVRILKPESLKRIETPQTAQASRTGLLCGYGLGNEWAIRNRHIWRGHNGAGFGNYSDFWYNRDLNIGYVVLINQFDLKSADKVRKLRELVARHLTAGREPFFQPIIAAGKEQLALYCGTYIIGYGAKDPLGLINFINGITKVRLTGNGLSVGQLLTRQKDNVFPVAHGLFRTIDRPDATVAFFTTREGAKAMVWERDYYEQVSGWKYWLTVAFICWSVLMMLSVIVVVFLGAFVYAYKRLRRKQPIVRWLAVKICLLGATLALMAGFLLIGSQELHFWGKATLANVGFLILTWLFTVLSVVSLISAARCFRKPVSKISRLFYIVASCTFVGWAVFLWSWGIIGLKLWL